MKKYLFYLTVFAFTILGATKLIHVQAAGTTLYVATNGSDTTGTGTIDKPFATLNKVQNFVTPGTTVYMRGGTYKAQAYITMGSGTAADPVTYTPYPGEAVLLDGTGVTINDPQALIRLYGVSYINIVGFEVANSTGRGLSADYTDHVTIKNNKVHDIQYRTIGGSGTNLVIDNNEIYRGAYSNVNNTAFPSGGWPGVLQVDVKKDGSVSQNVSITNNYVHDSWGEGILAATIDGGVVSNNRVKDVFSVSIYTGNSRNLVIDSNYISAENPAFYRLAGGVRVPAHGIEIASETNSAPLNFATDNIVISNNVIVKTRSAIRYWIATGLPYTNVKIFYNTFKDSAENALNIDNVTTSGNEFRNNIVYGKPSMSASGWTFSNNLWVTTKPAVDTSTTSFASLDPKFISPLLTGPAGGFALLAGSPAIGKAMSLASVVKDYAGSTRASSPSIGAFEFGGTSASSTPIPTPVVKVGDANGDNLVNEADYAIWKNSYLTKPISLGASNGDFDNSNKVDGIEYVLWINNYGK